ncbi:hypothetical protein [Pyxidicoccus xibeiensis]|uniref:hypothetical protein n=1 Tax=Pyxidicoccus xibeiensis TaxID=2906759 RepID=UPI0020A824DB|nr:hypothetical protein [Pyxidicoccus xibeiensis]MCP3136230.1 hypothetical protein [Pyxidicoccus xibeiensis]
MRRLSVVAVFAAVAMAVAGCGTVDEHQFARDEGSTDVVEMKASGAEQDFTWDAAASSASEQGTDASLEQQADSCSGSCNASFCSCYGTYECCRQGCNFCWEHLPQT